MKEDYLVNFSPSLSSPCRHSKTFQKERLTPPHYHPHHIAVITKLPTPPQFYHYIAITITLPPPPRCHHTYSATTTSTTALYHQYTSFTIVTATNSMMAPALTPPHQNPACSSTPPSTHCHILHAKNINDIGKKNYTLLKEAHNPQGLRKSEV